MPKVISVAVLALASAAPMLGQERTLKGIALDMNCRAIPGVSILLAGRKPIITDVNGRFEIRNLSGATVRYRAELAGFWTVERTADLRTNRHEERVFLLVAPIAEAATTSGGGQKVASSYGQASQQTGMEGRVLDENCSPLRGASIRALVNDAPVSATTNSDGRFQLDLAPLGTPDVQFTADGFIPTMIRGFTWYAIVIPLDRGRGNETVTLTLK